MTTFSQEIYKMLQLVQAELAQSQASGRTAKNDLSEAHYLGAWVTTAIKTKRFDGVLLSTLKKWQGQARSLGKEARLKHQFMHLETCYKKVLEDDASEKDVNQASVLAFCNEIEALDWMVNIDLTVGSRLNRLSNGKHSLIICEQAFEDDFSEDELLIKPLSIYIRGDQQVAINTAFNHGLLLYKKTDYKSKVKYHGEFLIFPNNSGTTLPELPTI